MLITPTDKDVKSNFSIFLAGPIHGVHDWQSEIAKEFEHLDITFFSPRRSDYETFDYTEQVQWESEHLRYADLIVFCVPPKDYDVVGRYYAQSTIYEFSEWINKGKNIIAYIDNAYPLFRYIQKRNPDIVIYTFNEIKDKIKSIFEEFSNRNPKIFFTSDTHFNQQRTLELSHNRRIFKNLSEMNETLIRNWNNTITNKDIVYHLGDFGDYNFVKYLKGKIRLITGNYEQSDNLDINKLKELGFESVSDKKVLEINGVTINLSHKPSDYNKFADFNLFGHIHGRQQIKPFGLDVGVDAQNFTPIDLETVLKFKDSYKYYDDEVWMQN